MSQKRICTVCGKEYRYCPRCAEFKNEPTWKMLYCSEECKDIYYILNKYACNHISATEAKDSLKDISSVKNDSLIRIIDKINSEIDSNSESKDSDLDKVAEKKPRAKSYKKKNPEEKIDE